MYKLCIKLDKSTSETTRFIETLNKQPHLNFSVNEKY